MKISFKNFLLNENKEYLGQRIGDILTAVQDLSQNSDGMGTRQLVVNSERIVNQIRRILHSNWSKPEMKFLEVLQKVGVSIARAIEDKDDLAEILPSVSEELEKLVSKMGVPVHSLGVPANDVDDQGEEQDTETGTAAPQGKAPPEKKQAPMQPPPQQPAQV